MRVGVAIPVRDQQRWIETCLTTVRVQTYPCAAYLVDDASTDGLYDFLTDRPSWWRLLARNPSPAGWPSALNQAAALAVGDGCDAVFTMNGDDFLRLDAVEQMVRALQTCDAVIPYTQQIGGSDVVQASECPFSLVSFVDHSPAVVFGLIRADVWQTLGGYAVDVNLPGAAAGYNELDFWFRFWKAGYTHQVVTDPVIYYRMHPGQLWESTTARHDEAMGLVYRKHPDLAAAAAGRKQE